MDTSKMIISLVAAIAAIAVATVVVYFVGCSIEEHFWVKGMKVEEWQALYLKVVGCTGLLVMISSVIWIVYSNILPAVNASGVQSDPRPIWILLTVLSLAECLVAPFAFKFVDYIPHLHIANILLGVVIFMLVYYLSTLFGTPNKFKYAPLGAVTFRG